MRLPLAQSHLAALAIALLPLTASMPARADAYFEAVTDLHPIGYWRLNETNRTAQVAINLGTLGAAAMPLWLLIPTDRLRVFQYH